MNKTHWKKLTNPDYFGSYEFSNEEDIVLTIKNVKKEIVTGERGRKEECTVAHFAENVKPLILNKTNMKTITNVCGSPFIEDWTGRKIALYVDHNVQFAGERVDGVRVRPFAPKQEDYICQECGSVIENEGKYTARAIAQSSQSKFGKTLCMECAKRLKEQQEAEAKEGDILAE